MLFFVLNFIIANFFIYDEPNYVRALIQSGLTTIVLVIVDFIAKIIRKRKSQSY